MNQPLQQVVYGLPVWGIAMGVIIVLLLVAVMVLWRKVGRLGRVLRAGDTPVGRLGLAEESLRAVKEELQRLNVQVVGLDDKLNRTVQFVALTRYQAFEDVGGDQSFSLAVLDNHQDGFVLTALHGRMDTRVYAKPLKDGSSPYLLTSEEQQVIQEALKSRSAADVPRRSRAR